MYIYSDAFGENIWILSMNCPQCRSKEIRVLLTRDETNAIRRRRECSRCKFRFSTLEKIETHPLFVQKKSNLREPFSVEKLKRGLQTAFRKRPIPTNEIENVIILIEQEIEKAAGVSREISSKKIGELVLKQLLYVDRIAYLRFLSVYQEFMDIDDFVTSVKTLKTPASSSPKKTAKKHSNKTLAKTKEKRKKTANNKQ